MPAKKHESDSGFGKYIIRWTGWIQSRDTVTLTGYWIAKSQEELGFHYSSTNGFLGTAQRMETQIFTDHKDEYECANIFTSAAEKSRIKQGAMARLIEYLKGLEEINGR